jgi:hypothetical protein
MIAQAEETLRTGHYSHLSEFPNQNHIEGVPIGQSAHRLIPCRFVDPGNTATSTETSVGDLSVAPQPYYRDGGRVPDGAWQQSAGAEATAREPHGRYDMDGRKRPIEARKEGVWTGYTYG